MILVTTKERILQYIDYKGLNVSEFLKLTDIKRGFLDSDKLNGSVSDIFIAKIIASCPDINLEWLITGEGKMLKNQISESNVVAEPIVSSRKTSDPKHAIQRIPLFNLAATMGLVPKGNGDVEEEFIIDYLSIPNLSSADGAIYAMGDSMSPYLNSGDIIAYKKIDVDMDNIFFGEVYLLSIFIDEFSTYKTIKYLHKSEKGDNYVRLVSANTDHQDKDVPLHKIAAMGLVRASIRIHN